MNDGMIFEVITALQDLHIEQLHALHQDEWWTKGGSLARTRQRVNCCKAPQGPAFGGSAARVGARPRTASLRDAH
jgi:hypothetical protein